MAKKQWQTLGEAVYALARDGVLIQRQLDASAAAEGERFVALLVAVPEPARPMLMPLAPPRLVVKEHHVSCSLHVTTTRSIGFSLAARPLNLGFSLLYGTTDAETATLSVSVRGTTS